MTEESVDQQIKAIESWALDVITEVEKKIPDYGKILENLDNIKAQGKKLLRRSGALKSLPKSDLAEKLKKMVLESVAAALLVRKDLKSEPTLNAGIRRNLRMMESLAVKSRELIEKIITTVEIPFEKFAKDVTLLEDFLQGEGDFEHLPLEVRRDQWGKALKGGRIPAVIEGLKIRGADLRGFDFSQLQFKDCFFTEINFDRARFIGTFSYRDTFNKVSFVDADLSRVNWGNLNDTLIQVNFTGANLEDAKFTFDGIKETSFKGANCKNAVFSMSRLIDVSFENANLQNAQFQGVYSVQNVSFKGADVKRANFYNSKVDISDAKNKDRAEGTNLTK